MEDFADQILDLATRATHGSAWGTMFLFTFLAAAGMGVYYSVRGALMALLGRFGKRLEKLLPGHKIKAVGESLEACREALRSAEDTLARHRRENDELRAVLDQVRARADEAAKDYLRLLAEHTAAKIELAHYRDKYGPLPIPMLTS